MGLCSKCDRPVGMFNPHEREVFRKMANAQARFDDIFNIYGDEGAPPKAQQKMDAALAEAERYGEEFKKLTGINLTSPSSKKYITFDRYGKLSLAKPSGKHKHQFSQSLNRHGKEPPAFHCRCGATRAPVMG